MLRKLISMTAFVCLWVSTLMAQGTQQPASTQATAAGEHAEQTAQPNAQPLLTEEDVRDLLKKNKKDLDVVYKALDERGVDFDLDRKIEIKMRRAGADDNMLQAIWKAGPTSRNSKSATLTSSSGVPLHARYEAAMGYKTLEEEFESKFPDSELMSSVYTQAARAYQQKGDMNKVVEYGEKSLKLDPNNLFSLLMVAITLPQPRMLEENSGLVAQRLSTADDYANRALKLIDSLPARPWPWFICSGTSPKKPSRSSRRPSR
jgi:tetratricopeptide (TPR) repeat protein